MNRTCPIRHAALPGVRRYPRYVGKTCASRATSQDGRPLAFGNVGFSGGYVAQYADTGARYDSHTCWIEGIGATPMKPAPGAL